MTRKATYSKAINRLLREQWRNWNSMLTDPQRADEVRQIRLYHCDPYGEVPERIAKAHKAYRKASRLTDCLYHHCGKAARMLARNKAKWH